jgi:intron-binding protein aquarius
LGEAEYVVAVYQYLRTVGYPASKISILTTYKGQKDLIRDILNRRCVPLPQYGMPGKLSTVDKYQVDKFCVRNGLVVLIFFLKKKGQQNDIVLLSLVRTKHVGHLRDVRRLIVAMSRARLGAREEE